MDQNSPKTLQYLKSLNTMIENFCSPLQAFSIQFFTYSRIYRDGRAIFLCNSDQWYETKFKHNLFEQEGFITVPNLYRNEYTKCIFTGEPNNNIKVLEHMFHLGYWNSIDLYKYHLDYKEVFHFSGAPSNTNIINFYINNFAFLIKYASYFRENISSLLDKPDNEIFIKVYNIKENILIEDHLDLDKTIYTPTTMTLFHKNQEITLSKRQTECLLLLLRGRTAKEIAKELTLSFRTIEKYLEHLKYKFDCSNRRELIEQMFLNESIKEYF